MMLGLEHVRPDSFPARNVPSPVAEFWEILVLGSEGFEEETRESKGAPLIASAHTSWIQPIRKPKSHKGRKEEKDFIHMQNSIY